MTLQEWSNARGIPWYRHEGGAVYVLNDGAPGFETRNDWTLWHLTDYAVSTVSGPVVWLTERASKEVA